MSVEIPLFPLNTVLFPGGALALKIFEPRYMEMATRCLKEGTTFGICLIEEGQEVGKPAVPHPVGTVARIAAWDMPQLGVLNVTVHGTERFRVLERREEPSGLVLAQVDIIEPESMAIVPEEYAQLVPLLRVIVTDLGAAAPPAPHRFLEAAWVGYRYCEVLPIPNLARQKLLELDDDLSRLEIILRYLRQKKLVE